MASKDTKDSRAQTEQQKLAEQEAQREMERQLEAIERNPNLSDEEKAAQKEAAQGTPGTPRGAGRAYEEVPSGTANVHGKASATRAGGDPVNSPVIGNPGEQNPIAGNYDYALAAARGNPQAATQPIASVEVGGVPRKAGRKAEEFRHPLRVRALRKGEYNGVKEIGEEFDNTRNLAPYPEDDKSWFEPVEDADYKAAEQRGVKRREDKQKAEEQAAQERAAIAKLAGGRPG